MTHDDEPANLATLPSHVHAGDEDLYRSVLVAICDEQGLDRRFAYGNIMDEYHECWVENYHEMGYEIDANPDDPDADLIPREAMIEFARDDLAYYSTHDPDAHQDHDVTKPSIIDHETWGDQIRCIRCEADRDFAYEDELIGLGVDERIRRIRAYVDTVIPSRLVPYDVRSGRHNVFYYELFHNDELIGSAQFDDSVDRVAIPIVQYTDHELFLNAHPDYEIREGRIMRKDDK